jgi:uncharacterized protein YbbC (DUF1343 family)
MNKIIYGIDNYLNKISGNKTKKYSVGIICNQSSVTLNLKYSYIELSKYYNIKYIFSPQHGFYSTEQANMIETQNSKDSVLNIPIISLYSETRKINPEYIKNLDFIIFDLQDVGSRYYTYLWTLYYTMEICEKYNKKLIVMDRPNIINGTDIEGTILNKDYFSFIGLHPILNRYGLTIGEFSLMLKQEKFKNNILEISKMLNWDRTKFFNEYNNHFIPPSPNLPNVNSCIVYPGMCLIEGTEISEGRGTTTPFEIIGAPFIDSIELIKELKLFNLQGVYFRPIKFRPTFDKFANQECNGIFLHITNRKKFRPIKTAIILIHCIKKLWSDKFEWYKKPYEYESEIPAIDLLYGNDNLRKYIDNDVNRILDEIESDKNKYKNIYKKFWLYK